MSKKEIDKKVDDIMMSDITEDENLCLIRNALTLYFGINNPHTKLQNEYFNNVEIEDNHFWLDVKNKSILIKADEEGVAVDIFDKPKPECFLNEPIASTWALYNE